MIHDVAIIFSNFVQTLVWRSTSSSWRSKTRQCPHLVILEQLAGPDDRCAWPRFVQVSASPWWRVCRATLTICWDLIYVDVDSEAESSPLSPVAKRHKLWAST